MMSFMRRRVFAILCLLASAAVAGCRNPEPDEPAVATPALTMSKDRVAIGSPVTLTYRFDVAPNAKIDADYWVFVHVLDTEGELLWTDDHLPAVPTSQWRAGQKVEYTRTVFAPNYPYIGPAVVRLGLYHQPTGRRLRLSGGETSRREYVVANFQVLPQSENIFLIYKEGWHPAEVATDNPASEWQWTQKTASISFRNPKRDSTFYIQYDARVDLFTPPQQVAIRVGGQDVATFPADSKDRKLLTFPITAGQLGQGDMAELVLDVDKTFKPGGSDTRELGIRVFHAYIEAK